MDKDTRNAVERATQRARKLLEEDFAAQLEGDFDVHREGTVAPSAGGHLSARQAFERERTVAAIEHKCAAGMSAVDATRDYLRDAAFTTLNRFVALKMLEARELVQECITKSEQSGGYREFCGMAPSIPLLPESAGYRLYLESVFDELSTEVKILFDRRDPSSVLWPKRATFEQLLEMLNAGELAQVWGEDETIGWVYQFFNGPDERRKMREESQAPRNSRELAVRNQFFTPRYVVQFLTDNTLGRIWYEMRGTNTALAEQCEYMVRKPGEQFASRAKKDPRDLRVLDPACGSGHFLLYAFDLLLGIYQEAHADPASPKSEVTGRTLTQDYPTIDALRKAVPSLILAHNLHGVDIDPRCAQIAQLALWMRVQRAYRDFGLSRGERPQIRRSNIIVAEPLVADDQLVKEFVARLRDRELGRVFTALVDALKRAAELGLLLRVETLVARGGKPGQTGDLFAPPEERISAALDRFIAEEDGRSTTRRRLFADDAMQGMGLLAIAGKKFDVVLMNPPFGEPTELAKAHLRQVDDPCPNEMAGSFIVRGTLFLHVGGRLGAITSSTLWFTKYLAKARSIAFSQRGSFFLGAELGAGVLDGAFVETALTVVGTPPDVSRPAYFGALTSGTDRASALTAPQIWREVRLDLVFAVLPDNVLAHWLSPTVARVFSSLKLESPAPERTVRHGLATSDDFRFIRLWHEVSMTSLSAGDYIPIAKGGPFGRYYYPLECVVNWRDEGREIKALSSALYGSETRQIQAQEYYKRPGLTYPFRSAQRGSRGVRERFLGFSVRTMPRGGVFAVQGMAIFASDEEHLLECLAVLNSRVGAALADLLSNFSAYQVGYIRSLPFPKLSEAQRARCVGLARKLVDAGRMSWSGDEAGREFVLPFAACKQIDFADIDRTCQGHVAEIDSIVEASYGLSDDDVAEILSAAGSADTAPTRGFGWTLTASQQEDLQTVEQDGSGTDEDNGSAVPGKVSLSQSIAAWLIGVAFGRFDSRLATGDRPMPRSVEPFDLIPARSPGMCPEGEEPHERPDILVDDQGHQDDLATRVLAIAGVVGRELPLDLRTWLSREFFPLHIRVYSKSRRKAPIYWQLATPSASYSVWVYTHAFTKDTLFRVQNDYVAPKLAHEERRLESLTSDLREKGTAAQRKELAAQEGVVEELRAFLEEVKRVAPLWNPNLNDGVIINFAPLWRLVPQNKPWQKELRATWDALCEGRYDWTHLAMHLWPERVVQKCAQDRSLAIAHGLDATFWVEGSDGKWTARKTPTPRVDELVRNRTSSAVKSALKSLLEAPAAIGKGGRGWDGRRRATAAAEEGDA